MLNTEGFKYCSIGMDILYSACEAAIMYSFVPLSHLVLDPIIIQARCQYHAR
jgi:hypothetical protein